MILKAEAEHLAIDERQRSWSYVLEGQQLRGLIERLQRGDVDGAVEILREIVEPEYVSAL